jgi:hypothetical protein
MGDRHAAIDEMLANGDLSAEQAQQAHSMLAGSEAQAQSPASFSVDTGRVTTTPMGAPASQPYTPPPVQPPPPPEPEVPLPDNIQPGTISHQGQHVYTQFAADEGFRKHGHPGNVEAPGTMSFDKKPEEATAAATPEAGTGEREQPPEKPATPGQPKPSAAKDYVSELRREDQVAKDIADRQISAQDKIAQARLDGNMAVSADRIAALNTAEEDNRNSKARWDEAAGTANDADLESTKRALDLKSKKMDPNRYFHDRGTFGKIMSAVAIGLGGFGASMGHHANFAQEMIDKAVHNDIDAQREDIANAREQDKMLEAISVKKYGRAMNQYELESRTTRDGYNYAKDRIDAHAMAVGSPEIMAQAELAKAGIDDALMKTNGDHAARVYGVLGAQEQADRAAANAGAGAANAQQKQLAELTARYQIEGGDDFSTARARAMMTMGAKGGNLPALPGKPKEGGNKTDELLVRHPDGQVYEAQSKEAAQKYREKTENIQTLRGSVDTMEQLNANRAPVWDVPGSIKHTENYSAAANQARISYKNATIGSARAPSEEESKMIHDMFPDITTVPLTGVPIGVNQPYIQNKIHAAKRQVDAVLEDANRTFLKNPPPTEADKAASAAIMHKRLLDSTGAVHPK